MIKNSGETEYNVFFAFFKTKDNTTFEEMVFVPKKSDDLKKITKLLKANFFGGKSFPSWVKVFSYGQLYPYQQVKFDLNNATKNQLPNDFLDYSIMEETKRVVKTFKAKNPEVYEKNKMFNIGLLQSKEKNLFPNEAFLKEHTSIVAMPFCISAPEGEIEKFFSHGEDEVFWNPVSESFISEVKSLYGITQDIECVGMVDSIMLTNTFVDTALLVKRGKELTDNEAMINRFDTIPVEENEFNSLMILSNDAVMYSYMTLDDYIEKNKENFTVEKIGNWLAEQDYVIDQVSSVNLNGGVGATINAKYLADVRYLSDDAILQLLKHLNPDDFYINKTLVNPELKISKLKLYNINLEEGMEKESIETQQETSDFSILVAYDDKGTVVWYETLYVLSMYGYDNFIKYLEELKKEYETDIESMLYNRIPYSEKSKKIVAPELYKKEI